MDPVESENLDRVTCLLELRSIDVTDLDHICSLSNMLANRFANR